LSPSSNPRSTIRCGGCGVMTVKQQPKLELFLAFSMEKSLGSGKCRRLMFEDWASVLRHPRILPLLKRSARPAKKLHKSLPISSFFSRFPDQAPLGSVQATRAPPSPKDMPTRSVSEDCLLHDDRGLTFGIQKTLTEFFACFFCASATLRERSRLRDSRASTRR
jgi:hypothetical protein